MSLVLARRVRVSREKLPTFADAVVDRMLLGLRSTVPRESAPATKAWQLAKPRLRCQAE